MNNKKLLSLIQYPVVLFAALLTTSIVYAESITPSHVFQSVESSKNELKLLHEANESEWGSSNYT